VEFALYCRNGPHTGARNSAGAAGSPPTRAPRWPAALPLVPGERRCPWRTG